MASKKLSDEQIAALPMSALLRLAVADARKAAKTPGYKLNMGVYHEPEKVGRKTVCSVCMAGSMLIGRVPRTVSVGLFESDGTEARDRFLTAVDRIRQGQISYAFSILKGGFYELATGEQREAMLSAGVLVSEEFNVSLQRATWRTYERAARILEKAGL